MQTQPSGQDGKKWDIRKIDAFVQQLATHRPSDHLRKKRRHRVTHLVVKALGFDAEDLPTLFDAPELGVTRWGTVRVDGKSMMTSLDGVFAAGDIVRGASLVVWAIRDGRDVTERMHAYLKAKARAARVAA